MADNEKGEREGLLTTIRARRKWYLGLYFLQIVGWLALVVFNEVSDTGSSDTVFQRIQDSAVTMSFIGQGTLVTTVFLIDVIFDGGCKLWEIGGEILGLIFSPKQKRNVFERRARKDTVKSLGVEFEGHPNLDNKTKETIAQVLADFDKDSKR